jgi:hypothetical protein
MSSNEFTHHLTLAAHATPTGRVADMVNPLEDGAIDILAGLMTELSLDLSMVGVVCKATVTLPEPSVVMYKSTTLSIDPELDLVEVLHIMQRNPKVQE